MFSGEICTQQAAHILIAVKYIWCNMFREIWSLTQLSMNTHAHRQNESLYTRHTQQEWCRLREKNSLQEKRLPLPDIKDEPGTN